MSKIIEEKTAAAIMQHDELVKIGRRTYKVARPSVGTLVMASAAVAKLPRVMMNPDTALEDVLRVAKDCRPIGEVIAIIVLGAKGMMHPGPLRWLKKRRIRNLQERILSDITPSELNTMTMSLFNSMQVVDFFGLTAFLTEVNMTRATKAVTTASGQL